MRFPTLSGEIDFDQDHPDRARATISVAAGDATTGVAVVDALVRSRDYLGADEYPTITFRLDGSPRPRRAPPRSTAGSRCAA